MYEAPETDDVIWKNLKLRKLERLVRIGLVTAATFFLVVFWLVPVGFVSALINLENLKKYLPIEPLLKASPALSGKRSLVNYLSFSLPMTSSSSLRVGQV